MIASIRGTVQAVDLDHAVVEVGGVGFAVRATPSTLAGLRRGEPAGLATTLVVREDSLTLYGFAGEPARDLFELLQTVTGVGPRLALAALAVLEPGELRAALSGGDIAALTRVPGIGRKGAERLIIELRDKVGPAAPGTGHPAPGTGPGNRDQVVEALVGLGFAGKQAEQAVDLVLADAAAPGETGTVLRLALGHLGQRR